MQQSNSFVHWIYDILIWGLAVITGPIGYFLARYASVGTSIWGNDVDGYGGDVPYRNVEAKKWFRKLWPDFWWSVIRNPANNLARSLPPTGKIIAVSRSKHLTTIELDSGRIVWFYYTPTNMIMFKFGYKIWNNKDFLVGKQLKTKIAFSIQKGHNIR